MRVAFIYSTDEGGFEFVRHSAMSLALSQKPPCDIHVFCHRFLPSGSDRLPAALRELGATLTLDRIEDAEVERALADGWSWVQIAEALGVTRQAVHKKHAKRLKEA